MEAQFTRHPAVPGHVPLSIPRTKDEAQAVQADLHARFERWIAKSGPLPRGEQVELTVHRELRWSDPREDWTRRKSSGFLEQYVTYRGEMHERIPAYLLIPGVGTPPFPAVVAHHQCFVDCDVGKEAVVGKAYMRPDQAYGFELVNRGYAVLAPDSVNCGERNIKGLREQGIRDKEKCWGAALRYLGVRSFYLKHLFDSMRAVDVLETLDFIDHHKIGMIGHSLGAGTTFWTVAYDTRVKAGVVSCHFLGGLSCTGWGHFYHAHTREISARGRKRELS